MIRKISIFSLIILCAGIAYANGGDMRVTDDGKFLALLSKAPYTPRQGVQNNMLVSFLRLKQGEMHHEAVHEPVLVKIRITKQGHSQEIAHMEGRAEGGIHEFSYTFADAGIHEIFVDVAFASNPGVWISFPDYMIDVQPALETKTTLAIIPMVGAFILGSISMGFLMYKRG
ncbi:MAG: hypothetical protein AAB372_03265 [Patescibacteria group bacterium]